MTTTLRMQTITAALLCVPAAIAAGRAGAQPGGEAKVPRAITTVDGKPATPKDVPFRHGEELTFAGSWMNINVGTGVLTVQTDATFDGKPAIRLKADVKSNARKKYTIDAGSCTCVCVRA